MADLRPVTCCFSGYRIEKMPFRNEDCPAARELFAALDAAGSLHDDVIAGTDIRIGRVKIIAFAVFFETDRNDFFHSVPRFCIG